MARTGKNKQLERQVAIRRLLADHEHLTIPKLCEELACSEATVRNDLREMERKALIKRVYGGAMLAGGIDLEHGLAGDTGVPVRATIFTEEKEAICRYVSEHILSPGQTIILDPGTTSVKLAKRIAELPYHLTVLTNSLEAAWLVSKNDRHVLHLAGGRYDSSTEAFQDLEAMHFFNSARADIYFLCPTGLSAELGIAVPGQNEAAIKQLMLQKAGRVIALADHSKLNKISFSFICGLDEVDLLVTDANADQQEVDKLVAAGLQVVKAPL